MFFGNYRQIEESHVSPNKTSNKEGDIILTKSGILQTCKQQKATGGLVIAFLLLNYFRGFRFCVDLFYHLIQGLCRFG